MKTLVLSVLALTLSTQSFAAKKLECIGDDRRDSTFTVKLDREALSAEIDESWGGGEELDTDTVKLSVKETAKSYIYTQVGASLEKNVEGFVLAIAKGRSPDGRLRMKASPSANNSRPFSVEVSCK